MKINENSYWDLDLELVRADNLAKEIDLLCKTNNRKKKALRQMNKALQRKNEYIKELESELDELIRDKNDLEQRLEFEYVWQNHELKEW